MNKKKIKVMVIGHEPNTMCKTTWQNEEIGRVQESGFAHVLETLECSRI